MGVKTCTYVSFCELCRWSLSFRCLVHLGSFCVWCAWGLQLPSSARGCAADPAPSVEKTALSLVELSWHPCWKSIDHKCEGLFLDCQVLFHLSQCVSLCQCHVVLFSVAYSSPFSTPVTKKKRHFKLWAVELSAIGFGIKAVGKSQNKPRCSYPCKSLGRCSVGEEARMLIGSVQPVFT